MPPRLVMVVGARPNFVKVAPVWHGMRELGEVELELLHTGQHYDEALSDRFLAQLELPEPNGFLGVGSGTHAEQTARVMVGVERYLAERAADAILVAGDVNSTMAAALAAAKTGTAIIHLEAGLRSGDWTMPEEVNRVVTDRVADLLLCPGEDARANLELEGIERSRIAVVGNTMIDSLHRLLPIGLADSPRAALGLERQEYVLTTLHRPATVDAPERLIATLDVLGEIARELPVLLPLHPRAQARLADLDAAMPEGVIALHPLSYLDFIALEAEARLVITDSGGVQEETSVLGVPCLTYRPTTERPITVHLGTNSVVGLNPAELRRLADQELRAPFPESAPQIPLWDGNAGSRSAQVIGRFLTTPQDGGTAASVRREERG